MADVLANVTQVINQSPQVSSLVGGHLAAAEEARLQAQAAESERQRQLLEKTVASLHDSSRTGETDPDARQRLENERRRKRRQARLSAAQASEAASEPPAAPRSDSLLEISAVIDVCV